MRDVFDDLFWGIGFKVYRVQIRVRVRDFFA